MCVGRCGGAVGRAAAGKNAIALASLRGPAPLALPAGEALSGGRVVIVLGPGSSLAATRRPAVACIRAAASRAGVPVSQDLARALATRRHNDQFGTHWKQSPDDGVADH